MSKAYHYTESGLDYVYLNNGFVKKKTPYGEAVSIENVEELHKAIGISIARSPSQITPEEIRFLRVEMGVSQKALGHWMDVSDQAIARWEKGKSDIPGPAIRLLKLLYLHFVDQESNVRDICERMAELDQQEPVTKKKFEDIEGHWQLAA